MPAIVFELRRDRRINRGGRALLGSLEARIDVAGLVDPSHRELFLARNEFLQTAHDAARMHRVGDDAVAGPSLRDSDREQSVGGFRLSVGGPSLVRTRAKIQVVEIHIRAAMTYGGEFDHSRLAGR